MKKLLSGLAIGYAATGLATGAFVTVRALNLSREKTLTKDQVVGVVKLSTGWPAVLWIALEDNL